MRRGGLAAGAGVAAAGAVALARRRRRERPERIEVVFDDGASVTLHRPSPARDELLAIAREAVRAARR